MGQQQMMSVVVWGADRAPVAEVVRVPGGEQPEFMWRCLDCQDGDLRGARGFPSLPVALGDLAVHLSTHEGP